MPATLTLVSRRNLFFADLSIGLSIILIFSVFRNWGDWILLISWVIIFGYLMGMKRYISVSHQLLATLIAALWVHYARDYYGYHVDFVRIFGMSSLPLMAWSLLLFGILEYCNYCKFKRKVYNFLLFFLVFLTLGLLFETIAYHLLDLRNTMTAKYAGLPICDCVHAPDWMKMVYFSMGPVYFLLTQLSDRLTGILRNDWTT